MKTIPDPRVIAVRTPKPTDYLTPKPTDNTQANLKGLHLGNDASGENLVIQLIVRRVEACNFYVFRLSELRHLIFPTT